MADDAAALLALLQLNDSAFPVGAFAHSYGLEQLVREGEIASADDVEAFVGSLVRLSIATSDATAAAVAARETARGAFAAIVRADHALHATKSASELRAASMATGLRTLQEVTACGGVPLVAELLDLVRRGGTPGTHAVAFGVAGGSLGAGPRDCAAALMLGAVNVILHASMRLLPVSHRDVQGALHRLRPRIASLAERAANAEVEDLAAFHPWQEIAIMRHRAAPVRLFAS